jgi:hypothetical protein
MQLVMHGVHRRHRDPEYAHDGDHRDAGDDFENGVAGKRAERRGIPSREAG